MEKKTKLSLPIALIITFLTLGACSFSSSDDDYSSGLLTAGEEAPDFVIHGADGDYLLSDLRGQTVVLEFWGSWCSDCKNAAADFVALYEQYASDSLLFLGYSVDTDEESYQTFITERGYVWQQTCDFTGWANSEVAQAYNLKWIPTFYIIDSVGRVVLGTINTDELAEKLNTIN